MMGPTFGGIGCCLTLLLCVSVSMLAAPGHSTGELSVRRSFWFESHGRDDMREWRAVILKGAQYIKIDINIRYNPSECLIQSRLPPSPTNYSQGCFLLCHYYSNATTDFNTTYDIVQFIADPRNDDLLSGSYGDLIFQMCIKHEPPFDDPSDPNSRGYKWIRLMDEFYRLMKPILARPNRRHVQFVFDSLPADEPNVYQHWPGWNATWTGNFAEAADNNATIGNNIFQMVNMEVTWVNHWDRLAAGGFFKFAKPHYAFVGWEPASEAAIQRFHQLFLRYNFTNPHGVLIAYNPDPSAFHTITANTTKRFAHEPFGSPNMSYPISVVTTVGADRIVITLAAAADYGAFELSVHQHGLLSTMRHVVTLPMTEAPGNAQVPMQALHARTSETACSTVGCNYTVDVWVTDVHGCFAPFSLRLARLHGDLLAFVAFAASSELTYSCTSPLASNPVGVTASARLETESGSLGTSPQEKGLRTGRGRGRQSPSELVTLVPFLSVQAAPLSSSGADGWGLSLSGWLEVDIVNNGTRQRDLSPFQSSELLASYSLPFDVTSLSVSAAVVAFAPDNEPTLNATLTIVWSDDKRQVFTAFAEVVVIMELFFFPPQVGISSVTWVTPSGIPSPVKLGVGESPSAAMLPARPSDTNPDPWVLISYGESFCYNNMIVDDDFGPFRGAKICSLQNATMFEMGQQPVQSYIFGRLGAYLRALEREVESPHRQGFATTCSDTLFQGMFDIAHRASVALIPKNDRLDWYVRDNGFLAVATARSLTSVWTTACGAPTPHEGRILIDSFPLFGTYNVSALYV